MSALIFAGALLIAPPPLAQPALPLGPDVTHLTDVTALIDVPLHADLPAIAPVADFIPGEIAPLGDAIAVVAAQAPPASPEPAQDIVVTGRGAWEAPDPFADVNTAAFEATMAVDSAIVAPLARTYKSILPKPVRDGIHNFLYNLREPVVALNFALQLKIGRALETVGRFAINTTIGIAGLFDMAKRKPFNAKRRSNGFANTFGFYGIKSGPFLFLPIVGPTTPRDLIGGALDRLLFPFVYGSRITRPEYAVPFAVLGALDHRAEFDDTLKQLHDGQADPYARSRDFYLQRRQNEIDELKGKKPRNSSPMSEAPTAPIVVRERSGTTLEDVPATPEAVPPR